jgi:hypothetical protein
VAVFTVAGVIEMTGQLVANVYARSPVQPLASVAVTEMLALTEVVGVPLSTPVVLFKVNPAGRDPEVTANVYGVAVLPVAETVCE